MAVLLTGVCSLWLGALKLVCSAVQPRSAVGLQCASRGDEPTAAIEFTVEIGKIDPSEDRLHF